MSNKKQFSLQSSDAAAIQLGLYRYVSESGDENAAPRKPVLLMHGASANHETFTTPDGGLAEWLVKEGFDPWLLDWRGSGRVVEDPRNGDSLVDNGDAYNFNLAAKHDVPDAIKKIREVRKQPDVKQPDVKQPDVKQPDVKIAIVGFCMGGGVLAESVALEHITAQDVDCIVLMTLGLFYETPIDGRLKCEDRVLERLEQETRSGEDPVRSIDPRVDTAKGDLSLRAPWHPELDSLYKSWPGALKSHAEDPLRREPRPDDPVNCMCNRLSFMYGMPYHHGNLVDAIHGPDSQHGLLPDLFGAIPLHMFIHGAQNIRKGHATFYRSNDGSEKFLSDEARERFRSLSKVTLITGALDRLWHRDSIDLMHEWLCRGTADHLRKFQKHVLPNYAHQDLLWGTNSKADVFGKIKEGLKANDHLESSSSASRQRLPSQGIPSRDAATSPRW